MTARIFLSGSLRTLVFHYVVLRGFLPAFLRLFALQGEFAGVHVGGGGLLIKYRLDSKLVRQSHKGVGGTLICYFPGASLGMMCCYYCDAIYEKKK